LLTVFSLNYQRAKPSNYPTNNRQTTNRRNPLRLRFQASTRRCEIDKDVTNRFIELEHTCQ